MATNYWSVDDVQKIGEQKVKIPSENGLSYTGGQKITMMVPPTVGMMDGKNSYLEFDVKLSAIDVGSGTPTLLQLDEAGAGVIFKNIRIYDGTRGNLIEELNEYSNLITLRYDYDTDDSKRNLRALEQGGTSFSIGNRSTSGATKSDRNDTLTNPYFKPLGTNASTERSQTTQATDAQFLTVKVCVPIHSGVFSGAVFPVAMSNGLYMEFDLQPAARVIKQLDNAVADRRLHSNPVYGQILEQTTGGTMASDWVNASTTNILFLGTNNNLVSTGDANAPARVPFAVGENINLMKLSDGTKATIGTAGICRITSISASSNGFVALGVETGAIGSGDVVTNSTGVSLVSGEWAVYSRSVCDAASYPAEYTISNFNLVVHEIVMDPSYMAGMLQKAREGKAIEFDIHSVTNYKNSLLSSDRQTSFLIHSQNSRAKSLVVQPCDSSIYTSAQLISASQTYSITGSNTNGDADLLRSGRSGIVGVCDELSSVQYQINGKLVPSRPISTKKCATRNSIDAFHLYELEKTLDNAGVVPRSFRRYLENWNLGRGFATQSGAMDLRDKDLSVLLKYEETAAPSKNKIINSFVFHVRRLIMRGSGSVEVVQ